nr:retrotransposon protein, putative, Ty1-copia subclass [Tanacetum cinerariifolium]
AVSVNGVFEIDMNNNVSKNNNNFIFSINKKRKLDLGSSYLWHCRLAHIGKTRMQKLQCEGLLESINDESFDKWESCISGKMTKKLFNNIKRATDPLGLLHTDVCGPLRHVSRKGASYFLTFTDDFSRYGYIYLLKHKHEVFENFKVLKSKVELQLGKKIKALRSDRGSEDLSQEFKDYLNNDLEDDHMDTLPSENTSEIPIESESLGSSSELIPVRRPDIAFAVGKLSRYKSNPGTQHWKAIQRASKKQTCITGSTMKSEFVALAAEWLKNLLPEIPLWVKPMASISIHCDSAATLVKAYSHMYNGKSRYLGVRHNMIRDLITNGVVSIEFDTQLPAEETWQSSSMWKAEHSEG